MVILNIFAVDVPNVKELYRLSIETKEVEKKKEFRQKILTLAPESEYGIFSKAWFKEIAGDYSQAEELYSEAILLNSKLTMAFLNRGRIKLRNSDNQGAVSDFLSAKELEPKNAEVYGFLCYSMRYENDRSTGMNYCNQAVELDPKSIFSYYSRSTFKLESGDSRGALKDANKIIEISPKDPLGWEARGSIYITLNNKKAGCADLSRSGELGNTAVYDNMKEFCK
ncbi:tetratricopeptide repeat protein [Leptospira interrogans serovar Australis str. 200703203]|nr:tetratricopeptide repeat protein [Leptospira interrogans serovar Australis str. 200703203]